MGVGSRVGSERAENLLGISPTIRGPYVIGATSPFAQLILPGCSVFPLSVLSSERRIKKWAIYQTESQRSPREEHSAEHTGYRPSTVVKRNWILKDPKSQPLRQTVPWNSAINGDVPCLKDREVCRGWSRAFYSSLSSSSHSPLSCHHRGKCSW